MKLTLFQKETHWVIYEKNINERIFRGRIIPFPSNNSFMISYDKIKSKVRAVPNDSLILLRLKSDTLNLKGLLFVSATKKQISWHLNNQTAPFMFVEEKNRKITISNQKGTLANIDLKDRNNIELDINNNDITPDIIIGSFILLF